MRKFLFFLVCLAILAFVTRLFFNSFLREMPVEQILWHLQNPMFLKGAGRESFLNIHYVLMLALYLFLAWLLYYGTGVIAHWLKKPGLLQEKESVPHYTRIMHLLRLGAGCIAIIYLLSFLPALFKIYKFHYGEPETGDDFIAENYYAPNPEDISFPDGKNNLVIILAESMENTFGSLQGQPSFIPNLQRLRAKYAGNENFSEVHGAGWTIGAETAWFFGLPLKAPHQVMRNKYIPNTGFLPGALSIFDILENYGYECVVIFGSAKEFAGTDKLFERGNFEIRDKNYFESLGFSTATYGGLKKWGFKDSFILEQALFAYNDLIDGSKPFVLFVKTLDTHFPTGYCPPERKKYDDIRDAVANSDREISEFVEKLLAIKKEQDRLVICVIGDHYYMERLSYLEQARKRRIFNAFIGKPVPEFAPGKKTAPISALDMAPTILQLAGARWTNGRFGLGASLFSPEPALAEKLGVKELNENLAKKSDFYSRLYYRYKNSLINTGNGLSAD